MINKISQIVWVMALLGVRDSSKMAVKTAAILDFTTIYFRVVKYDTTKHFAAFGGVSFVFLPKKVKNTHFYSKIA